jgi:hypothetical protein
VIELTDIQEQELSKLAGFAVSPQSQRVGYTNKKQYNIERDLSLAVIKGKSQLLFLADRYGLSYVSGGAPTVLQYRDYLFSLLLVEMTKDFQYYHKSSLLTNHTRRAWEEHGYRKLWPSYANNREVTEYYGWGPLGTLSYLVGYSPNKESYSEANWTTLVKDCLKLAWMAAGQTFSLTDNKTPNDRLQGFLDVIGINDDLIALTEELFKNAYIESEVSRRRNGDTSKNLDLIKQRLIFREIPQDLYNEAMEYAPDQLKEDLSTVYQRLGDVLRPCGVRLLLQAIVVECLYKAAFTLTDLGEAWVNKPLVDLVRDGPRGVKETVTSCWVTLSDAKYLQLLFNDPPIEYKETSNVKLWLSQTPLLNTTFDAPVRLSSFL